MDAAAFATVEDLENRYRALSVDEINKAEALLEDAAVLITCELNAAGIKIDSEDVQQQRALKIVSCSVVKRAMATGGDSVTQMTTTTGPFSRQLTFANPTADLYLTKQDKRMLGIAQVEKGCFSMRPSMGGESNG